MILSGVYPRVMTDRRLLLVHAHPDDETIGTGATMAKYAARGDGVTLVTARQSLALVALPVGKPQRLPAAWIEQWG